MMQRAKYVHRFVYDRYLGISMDNSDENCSLEAVNIDYKHKRPGVIYKKRYQKTLAIQIFRHQ